MLVETIEEAVRSAARKKFGSRRDMEVQYNDELGEVRDLDDGAYASRPIDEAAVGIDEVVALALVLVACLLVVGCSRVTTKAERSSGVMVEIIIAASSSNIISTSI